MKKYTIAVLGSGRMGSGIAQVCIAAGNSVSLFDPSSDALAAARKRIAGYCELLGQSTASLAELHCSTSLTESVAAADIIIEAAPERLDVKLALFEEVDAHARSTALFASNTSAIPISRIAAAVCDRSRFLGMHFWNPPHLVPLVEVISTPLTDANSVARGMTFLQGVGMTPVHVRKDIPGFVGNRLQHALKREAIALVANGVCDAATVDKVVREGFGARLPVLGPLEQSDLVGLELTRNIHETLLPDLDISSGPHPYLLGKIAAGDTGMKAGRGFYEWDAGSAQAVEARLDDFLVKAARERIRQRATQPTTNSKENDNASIQSK